MSGQVPEFTTTGTITKSFDLQSLYFACVLEVPVDVGQPVDCTISLTGIKAGSGHTIGPLYLKFSPAGLGQVSPMALGTVGGAFVGLSDVRIAILELSLPPQVQSAAVVIHIDDVKYITY